MSNKLSLLFLLIFVGYNLVLAQEKTDSTNLKLPKKQAVKKKNSRTKSKSDVAVVKQVDDLTLIGDTIVTNGDKNILIDTTTNMRKKGNPVVATLCSMVVPGLGQAYNKKYWKIPIIYTIFGSMYFFARNNHQKFKDFKFAYKNFETDQKPVWVRENVKADYLKNRMEFYKRNRNFNIIVGSIFYLLNILDANVDAHLMDFDVGDDLSLRVAPNMGIICKNTSQINNFGLKFVITINKK